MAVRVVQLGSPRVAREGVRIGTVRRPPRGVPKERFASENWYDVWFPILAPSAELVKKAHRARTAKDWAAFRKAYRSEMASTDAARTLDLLAALSHTANF
ncbi:MAG TPA: DUF488 family protein, partial [Fimbriiglobus sp.]